MDLTPIQRKVLLRYRTYRDCPPTLGRILSRALRSLLILLVVVLIGGGVFPFWVTAFYAGIVVGAAVFLITLAVQAWRITPALLEAMDWKKVDRLLGMTAEEEF